MLLGRQDFTPPPNLAVFVSLSLSILVWLDVSSTLSSDGQFSAWVMPGSCLRNRHPALAC